MGRFLTFVVVCPATRLKLIFPSEQIPPERVLNALNECCVRFLRDIGSLPRCSRDNLQDEGAEEGGEGEEGEEGGRGSGDRSWRDLDLVFGLHR